MKDGKLVVLGTTGTLVTALQKGTVPDIVDVLKGHEADAVLLVAA